MARQQLPIQTISFLEIPQEIRAQIYNRVLRPDCRLVDRGDCEKQHDHPKRFHGCTKILLLNKQVYCEAIEHLHQVEIPIDVRLHGLPIFRHPKAFGRPGMFDTFYKTSACLPFPRFSELQFLRFRKACLIIQCSGSDSHRSGIGYKLRDIAKAIRKSQHLRSMRLQFKSFFLEPDSEEDLEDRNFRLDMKAHLWDIVQAAHSINCELIVERHPECIYPEDSHDDEPLIPWLLHAAFLEV